MNARAAIVEVLQLVEGSIGLARVVVIEGGVPPAVCHTLVAVVLWPPPEESLHAAVAVQFGNQVGSKLALALLGIRVGGCIVVAFLLSLIIAVNGPRIAVARLYNPDVFAVVFVLQRCQGRFQRFQRTMISRVVAEPDDVVINGGILHAVKVVCQYVGFGRALAVDDDFRVRTLLATGLTSLLQQIEEAVPVGVRRVGVTAVGSRSFDAPHHAIRNLVTRLDVVGGGTSGFQLLQTVLCVGVNLFVELCVVEALPSIGRPLLAGVCPRVAIVEVKHEGHALVLDALA